MSLDLVSKSLELEDRINGPPVSKKRKEKNVSKNAMDFIRSDRLGVWKELRKVEKNQQKEVVEKRKKQAFKSALELYNENDFDNTARNVEALLKATELGKVRNEAAEKILYQQPCRLSKDIVEDSRIKEETSVFTDEDFEKFAREYNP